MSNTNEPVAVPVKKSGINTHKMIQIAMLGAIATVLMLFEFPMPFLAPSFYEFDFSELPVLIGGFAMGPIAGILIEALKIVLHLLIKGTHTAFVGELGNFLIGCGMVIPASLVYQRMKSKKGAVIGLISGTLCMSIAGAFVNAFLLLPAYGKAFGMPVEAFVEMGAAIHASVNSLFKFCLLLVTPFNLVKGAIISVLSMLLYKRISILLKSFWNK
ncbi:MAG: ECF transporter S component [Eubacterium sp.]|nr:ECF transporter S component [Eubacterium sp.]